MAAVAGWSLAARLRDNESILLDAYRKVADGVDAGLKITLAAKWLLDNHRVVEEQIREIHDDLPRSYYRQLPKLAAGPCAGYPRVSGVAWAFVAHTDSRFDPGTLRRFVHACQRVQPLTIGELCAVAITLRIRELCAVAVTLRIVLLENLLRCSPFKRVQKSGPEFRRRSTDRQISGILIEPQPQIKDTSHEHPTQIMESLVQRLAAVRTRRLWRWGRRWRWRWGRRWRWRWCGQHPR